MRALEPAVPERLTAGGSTTAGILIFGGRRRDGAMGTFYETHGGGEGARAHRDGVPVVRIHLTNTMNTPAEIVEAEYMIRVDEQRLRPNSAGAGRHKGGAGLLRSYTVLADGMSLTTMFERRDRAALRPAGRRRRRALPRHACIAPPVAAASFPARRTSRWPWAIASSWKPRAAAATAANDHVVLTARN